MHFDGPAPLLGAMTARFIFFCINAIARHFKRHWHATLAMIIATPYKNDDARYFSQHAFTLLSPIFIIAMVTKTRLGRHDASCRARRPRRSPIFTPHSMVFGYLFGAYVAIRTPGLG